MKAQQLKTATLIFRISQPVRNNIIKRIDEISNKDRQLDMSKYLRECVAIDLDHKLIK